MHKLHEMLEKIEETMAEQLNKGIDNVDTKEFGDVADIYKDLMCAKKDYLEDTVSLYAGGYHITKQ